MPDEDVESTDPPEADEPEAADSNKAVGPSEADVPETVAPDEADAPETAAPDEAGAAEAADHGGPGPDADDGRSRAPEGAEDGARKTRLERILREYRSTLRNESDSGHDGFSADDYRSQKPPHW